ncbi:MAG: DoxX family protein [Egibacteraceae bacterium]
MATLERAGETRSPSTRRRVANVALWVLQIGAGVGLLATGAFKLLGTAQAVEVFNEIGVGQWLRYVTGVLEIIGAVGMLTRRFSGYGALLLTGVMAGAVLAELLFLNGEWQRSLLFMVATAVVAWGRRDRMRISR